MKLGKFLLGLTLCVMSFLFLGNLSHPLSLTQPSALAQQTTITCNLPESIAITFLDAKCTERVLEKPEILYRYYTVNNDQTVQYKYGRYLTTNQYDNNGDVISNLALDQTWGNKANMIETVTLPAGTTVYQGITGPQNPPQCYPGGGQQTFINDTRDPKIIWSEGQPIEVEAFSCNL